MTTQHQIEELVRDKLVGREIDPVGFMDNLLALAALEGEIRCTFSGNEALQFTVPGQQLAFEVGLDRARGKLRMLCARLSVLCKESGKDVSLYGGEGMIERNGPPNHPSYDELNRPTVLTRRRTGKWATWFKNTPAEHEFTIVAE